MELHMPRTSMRLPAVENGRRTTVRLEILRSRQDEWQITGSTPEGIEFALTTTERLLKKLYGHCFSVDWVPPVELSLDKPLDLDSIH
ncbi:MAG: hypothetical protein PHH60_03980 [Candidatus Margulisbacteria bacterium]|nr:hypothetical protein [Candidatus Margulisiibacteriota bacterium]